MHHFQPSPSVPEPLTRQVAGAFLKNNLPEAIHPSSRSASGDGHGDVTPFH